MCLYIIIYMFIIILYIIIYLYLYIIIFIYIIIIYIVMCPKNGTIFILRVPGMGLLFFLSSICLYRQWYWFGWKYPWCGVFCLYGGDFTASYFYILKSMDFICVLVWYFGVWNFSVMKSVSGLFVDFGLGWEDSTI